MERDIAGCKFVRGRMGDDYALMFDPLEGYTLAEALTVAQALQRLGFLWLEDPIPAERRSTYRWLAERVNIPLVAADALQWSWNDYAEAAAAQCPVMFRLDSGRQGITFTSRMIEMANAHGVRCEMHAFGPEANSVCGLHTALAQTLPSYYEGYFPRRDFAMPGVDVPTHHDAAGRVPAPERPGLGNVFDWADLEPRMTWLENRR